MNNIHKFFILIISAFLLMSMGLKQENYQVNKVRNKAVSDSTIKYDETTGLVVSEHLNLIIANCTGCHSSKLITQFHTDRQGWLEKIRWMQQKQKLWDLGEAEPKILDYLSKNYPPVEKVSRRANLKKIDWYKL
jgi:hypothetical protein